MQCHTSVRLDKKSKYELGIIRILRLGGHKFSLGGPSIVLGGSSKKLSGNSKAQILSCASALRIMHYHATIVDTRLRLGHVTQLEMTKPRSSMANSCRHTQITTRLSQELIS